MKKLIVAGILLASVGTAYADHRDRDYAPPPADWATVVSVQPRYIVQNQQQCRDEIRQGEDNSGVGSVIGGVAGAVIGNSIAGRHNKGVGTVVGGVAGAVIGNNVGKDNARPEQVRVCTSTPVSIPAGKVVTFEYHGQRFTQTFDR